MSCCPSQDYTDFIRWDPNDNSTKTVYSVTWPAAPHLVLKHELTVRPNAGRISGGSRREPSGLGSSPVLSCWWIAGFNVG